MSFRYIKVKTKGQNEGEKLLEPQLRFKEFKNNYYYEQIKNLITNKAETYNPLKDVTSHKCIELENINPDSGSINGYTNSIDLKSTKYIFHKRRCIVWKIKALFKKILVSRF